MHVMCSNTGDQTLWRNRATSWFRPLHGSCFNLQFSCCQIYSWNWLFLKHLFSSTNKHQETWIKNTKYCGSVLTRMNELSGWPDNSVNTLSHWPDTLGVPKWPTLISACLILVFSASHRQPDKQHFQKISNSLCISFGIKTNEQNPTTQPDISLNKTPNVASYVIWGIPQLVLSFKLVRIGSHSNSTLTP